MVPAVARARDDGDTPSPEPPGEDADRTEGDGEELAPVSSWWIPRASLPLVTGLFGGGLAAMALAALWASRRRDGAAGATDTTAS